MQILCFCSGSGIACSGFLGGAHPVVRIREERRPTDRPNTDRPDNLYHFDIPPGYWKWQSRKDFESCFWFPTYFEINYKLIDAELNMGYQKFLWPTISCHQIWFSTVLISTGSALKRAGSVHFIWVRVLLHTWTGACETRQTVSASSCLPFFSVQLQCSYNAESDSLTHSWFFLVRQSKDQLSSRSGSQLPIQRQVPCFCSGSEKAC